MRSRPASRDHAPACRQHQHALPAPDRDHASVYLCTGSSQVGQRRLVQCTAFEHQIVDEPDTCFHEAAAVSPREIAAFGLPLSAESGSRCRVRRLLARPAKTLPPASGAASRSRSRRRPRARLWIGRIAVILPAPAAAHDRRGNAQSRLRPDDCSVAKGVATCAGRSMREVVRHGAGGPRVGWNQLGRSDPPLVLRWKATRTNACVCPADLDTIARGCGEHAPGR
jgi:hypothetical protein